MRVSGAVAKVFDRKTLGRKGDDVGRFWRLWLHVKIKTRDVSDWASFCCRIWSSSPSPISMALTLSQSQRKNRMEKNKIVTGRRKRALRSAAEASARPELSQTDSSGNRRPLPEQTEFAVAWTSEFRGDSGGDEAMSVARNESGKCEWVLQRENREKCFWFFLCEVALEAPETVGVGRWAIETN